MGIGVASSMGAYTYQNWDRDIDGVWIGKLGYETTFNIFSSYISSKIVSNPATTAFVKSLQKYALSRGTGLVDMFAYSWLFGVQENETQERLNQLMANLENESPGAREEILALSKSWQERGAYEKFKEELLGQLPSLLENEKDPDFDEILGGDLSDPETQELLMAMVAVELYQERKGDLISLGDAGVDRYAFHAAFGLLMLPRDMIVTKIIYDTLCMGQLRPKLALVKALSIFLANRLSGDQLYYWARRESVNQ
jgi:hypothetical protein